MQRRGLTFDSRTRTRRWCFTGNYAPVATPAAAQTRRTLGLPGLLGLLQAGTSLPAQFEYAEPLLHLDQIID
jgi:hypothetical protein